MVGKTAPGMRLGTLLVTFVLALPACSGEDSSPTTTVAPTAPPTTTTTTTTAPPTTTTTTTTPAPTTTVDPMARPDVLVSNFDRDSVDDFDTTGDNLWVVMMEIQDLYDFFEGNPQSSGPEMLGMFYLPTYENFRLLADDLQQLVDNDWRYVDRGTHTVAIDVETAEGDTAVVDWASQRGEQRIADANDRIVETHEGWDLDLITYRLIRGDDGRWRIAEFLERVYPVPEETINSMVPVEWTGRNA